MDLADSGASLDHNIVSQLLLSRGVAPHDLDRHRNPSLRDFLPDPSAFRDMEAAAERLAQAVLSGETVTVYGDYDVDGATSAALLTGQSASTETGQAPSPCAVIASQAR